MRLRSIFATGVYLSLIPLVGATGTWTEPMAAAPFANVEAPSLSTVGTQNAPTTATEPPIRAARLERRNASNGLPDAVTAIGRTEAGSVWLAWTAPIQKHTGRSSDRSWYHDVNRCVLDDDGNFEGSHGLGDDAERLVVFIRLTKSTIDRVAIADSRCTVDAGAKTVYFLDSVSPAQSVAMMADLVRQEAADTAGNDDDYGHGRGPRGRRNGLVALALTADPSADRVLEEFVTVSHPRWLRRDAAFWLGASRGAPGAAIVERLARTDRDSQFREHLTFVLTLVGDRGIDTLIDLARHDTASNVRGQALFWLGQKAGERAVRTLRSAVDDDPDHDVRLKAVFAISQLPRDQSVPKLIELARTHRDPEVRKQAMFWLGQTGDARAVEFFETVLKK
jgi:HEAT repeat protein